MIEMLTEQEFEERLAALEWVSPDVDKEGWQRWYDQRVALSQLVRYYEFDEGLKQRIAYGEPDDYMPPEDGKRPCHDCGVEVGQLHIPGCDAETCPACHGQAISCKCTEEDEIEQVDSMESS